MRRRGKSLGTEGGSLPLRTLQDALSASSWRNADQRGGARNDLRVRPDAAAESKIARLSALGRGFPCAQAHNSVLVVFHDLQSHPRLEPKFFCRGKVGGRGSAEPGSPER